MAVQKAAERNANVTARTADTASVRPNRTVTVSLPVQIKPCFCLSHFNHSALTGVCPYNDSL